MEHSDAKELGQKLVVLCRENRDNEALDTLYADHAISVEATSMTGTDDAEFIGLDAIRGKHEWWSKTMEVHSTGVDGPYYHGDDKFAVIFEIDATNRESGERMTGKEVGIYFTEQGKIVREEFYYKVD